MVNFLARSPRRIEAARRWKAAVAAAAVFFAVAAAGAERPKIGLALSGGSARGIAHVGVLQVLEELRVPVDYVAGTSMGAVVGGLYAAGLAPGDIAEILTGLDWQEVMSDRTAYRDLVFRRKEDERRYLMDVELGVGKGGLALPAGLRSGQKLTFRLLLALRHVAEITDFSRLPTPFAAVAVDIGSGETVVLQSGRLPEALRASMAIPGIFSPVELDGHLLVDGGLTNNLPVDVVRAMGADVVIAVDASEPLMTREELQSFLDVAYQAVSVLTRENMEARLADADLVLRPAVGEIGSMAFDEAPQIIELGAEEARNRRHELARWSVGEEAWKRWRAARGVGSSTPVSVSFVRVEGAEHVDERRIRRRIRTRAGDVLDPQVLEEDLARVYGLAEFQQAIYRLVEEDGRTGLVLEVQEKPWGPAYLHFGLNLASDLEGETGFTALVNLTRGRLDRRGGEWRNELEVGENQGALTELYQPLDFAGRWFVAPRLTFETDRQSVFAAGRKIAEYEVRRFEAGLDLGRRIGRFGELRLGALSGDDEAEVETGSADLPAFDAARGGLRARLVVDSTDSPGIPRRGVLLRSSLFLSRPGLGADLTYEKLDLEASGFLSHGRHTWLLAGEGGTGLGSDVPFFDQFRIGGLLSLGGYAEGQLRGPVYGVSRLGYYYRLFDSLPGLGGVYAGALAEAGGAWQSNAEVGFDDLSSALTLWIAAETFFGPFFVGYGVADDGSHRFYLELGRTF